MVLGQLAEDLDLIRVQANLLLGFAKRGSRGIPVVVLDPPTREGNLPCVVAQPRCTQRKQHPTSLGQREQYRSIAKQTFASV